MDLPTPQSPTHSEPRMEYAEFLRLLKSKNSPAVPEAAAVWSILVREGIDPSFSLAQFRVESQYGTSGFARETGSWGNMLYDANLTQLSGPTITKTVDGREYRYATYTKYTDAVQDYVRYLHWYGSRYGLWDIYGATARWIGRAPGSSGHSNYVSTIINDMIEQGFKEGEFYEVGDVMIQGGFIDKSTGRLNRTIFVKTGTELFRGTTGSFLKKLSPAAGIAGLDLKFLGLAQGSPAWGAVLVGIPSIDDGAGTVVYIKNPDLNTVKVR